MADSVNGSHPNGDSAGTPDRLMHGEDSGSRLSGDVAHWIGAYSELLGFKDRLLSDLHAGRRSLSEPASAEIEELDVKLILAQRARYARRLEFWTRVRTESNRRSESTVRPS